MDPKTKQALTKALTASAQAFGDDLRDFEPCFDHEDLVDAMLGGVKSSPHYAVIIGALDTPKGRLLISALAAMLKPGYQEVLSQIRSLPDINLD
jgi:hypothetical protein